MNGTIQGVGKDLCPQIALCATATEAHRRELVADERLDCRSQPCQVERDTL